MKLVPEFRIGRTFKSPARTYHEFKPESPMREFEEKMSYESKEILVDITSQYYREQQEQLENPEYDSHEMYGIGFEATKAGGNFAYAVKKAEEIKQRHLEEQHSIKKITPATATKNALKSGITADESNKAKGVEQSEQSLENIKEGETKDD